MSRVSFLAAILLAAPIVYADGFDLAPGERVVSVDGTPVATAQGCPGGVCKLRPVTHREVRQAVRQSRHEIRKDVHAYNWALREAQLCAENGYRNGHPRGVPAGYSSVGTGYSHSPDRPVHCLSEYSASTYKARAMFHCTRTNRYYWAVVR